jgi:thermitase
MTLSFNLLFIFVFVSLSTVTFADQFIVKYKNPLSSFEINNPHIKVLENYVEGQFYVIETNKSSSNQLFQILSQNKNIEYIVPNSKVFLLKSSNENRTYETIPLQNQWAIKKIQAEQAWQNIGSKGSRQIKVAVIDTGADYKHFALAPNMIKGYNFIENNEDPMDYIYYGFPGHGTHCSGIIGATGLIKNGTTGVSPEVSIMPLRFINDEGGLISNAIKAIDFAIANKAHIISASWGGRMTREQARPLLEAITRAENAGVMFVTAAANEGKNNDTFEVYPANARLSNTISVAATDEKDLKPDWSNFGKKNVDIAAPGNAILSTLPGHRYGSISGTSMAAPMVAGLVGLIKSQDGQLSPTQIKSLLQASGDKVNVESACDCRINAANAVEILKNKTPFLSPYATTLTNSGQQLQFEIVYANISSFNFESSNPDVASITLSGLLTAHKNGFTIITATDDKGRKISTYKIYVSL